MYRYLALIWDTENNTASAEARAIGRRLSGQAPLWSCIIDEPGFSLFHTGASEHRGSSETRTLRAATGALCGRAFLSDRESDGHALGAELDAQLSHQIVSSRGESLIRTFWGRYVAFIRAPVTGEVCVVRDPTGALPCFVTRRADVHIVFSDIEACLGLGIQEFSINWKYIAAHVPCPGLQIRDTGLREVTEVQPGERLTFRRATVERDWLWNPIRLRREGAIHDPDEAAALVRSTVRKCVHAWASLHRSIIHNLSGGLDSSIVLSCLADAPGRPKVTCLNYFAPETREDERVFARIAAERFRSELIECAVDPKAIRLDALLGVRLTPKPSSYTYDLQYGAFETRFSAEHGATAVFAGAGGDSLFFRDGAELATTDCLLHRGARPSLLRVALDVARVTRRSVWSVLREALALHVSRGRPPPVKVDEERTLIPKSVRDEAVCDVTLVHPWLKAASEISPGFRYQIASVLVAPAMYSHLATSGYVERTAVLLSQPLVELCLRIPGYVWISGGLDRAVARRAFAPELPRRILWRTDKGTVERSDLAVLRRNERFIREMLLDGLLVSHHLLDRKRLEQFLGPGFAESTLEYTDIIHNHLCTEIWLQRWKALTTSSGSRVRSSVQ
ncbi:MAG: hypothetical protein IRZ28_19555 [Steroidobacteraceae bacterium]|nr:hypothetical protein [Steroidobacteraceae bacterium]